LVHITIEDSNGSNQYSGVLQVEIIYKDESI
jgi:hypothetical protein